MRDNTPMMPGFETHELRGPAIDLGGDPFAEDPSELTRYMALYGERDGSAWFADDFIEGDDSYRDEEEWTDQKAEWDIQDRENEEDE